MNKTLQRIETFIQTNIDNYHTQHRLLRDVAYECLKDAIMNVDVQEGDLLSEVRLSNALGISRTPTRTAIQQLAQEGLLQIIPGRAVAIASRSVTQVLEALEVREMLEPEVSRRAAEAVSEDLKNNLIDCTTRLEAAAQIADRSAWASIDAEWHEVVCRACSNAWLGQIVLQAKLRMYKQGVSSQVTDEFLILGTLEHREIADAIIQGDGDKAYRLTSTHLQNVRKNIFRTRDFRAP